MIAKRRPKPEPFKIEGNWKGAVKESLAKKKPPDGWPKHESLPCAERLRGRSGEKKPLVFVD